MSYFLNSIGLHLTAAALVLCMAKAVCGAEPAVVDAAAPVAAEESVAPAPAGKADTPAVAAAGEESVEPAPNVDGAAVVEPAGRTDPFRPIAHDPFWPVGFNPNPAPDQGADGNGNTAAAKEPPKPKLPEPDAAAWSAALGRLKPTVGRSVNPDGSERFFALMNNRLLVKGQVVEVRTDLFHFVWRVAGVGPAGVVFAPFKARRLSDGTEFEAPEE